MIFNKMVVSRTGRRIPLQPPANFTAQAGNAQVALTWTDPENETSGGTTYATWDYTRIVRKTGSSPADENDGELVVESSQKNQYQTTGFVDDGLVNDTLYYYAAFAYNTDGVASEGAFTSATPMAGTPLAELAEGTLIKILENGSPVEFFLAKHSYEPDLNGAGRELLVRKDLYDQRQWNSTNDNPWENCTLRSWLNGDYKGLFSANVQALMGTTTYYYTPENNHGNVSTRADSVFMVSVTELGKSEIWINVEGSVLPIAGTLQIARLNGTPTTQWTRTRSTSTGIDAWAMTSSAAVEAIQCSNSHGSRPCFTLPSTALVDQDLNLIETSSATQEAAA